MQNIIDKLKESGYKITPQRQEIIQILYQENKLFSVDEIHAHIMLRFPNVSADTIYRTVSILEHLELVDRADFGDGIGRYKLLEDSHHHHLICLSCGLTEDVNFCPLDYLDQQQIKDKNFAVAWHNFDIFGYCAKCSEKQ